MIFFGTIANSFGISCIAWDPNRTDIVFGAHIAHHATKVMGLRVGGGEDVETYVGVCVCSMEVS